MLGMNLIGQCNQSWITAGPGALRKNNAHVCWACELEVLITESGRDTEWSIMWLMVEFHYCRNQRTWAEWGNASEEHGHLAPGDTVFSKGTSVAVCFAIHHILILLIFAIKYNLASVPLVQLLFIFKMLKRHFCRGVISNSIQNFL